MSAFNRRWAIDVVRVVLVLWGLCIFGCGAKGETGNLATETDVSTGSEAGGIGSDSQSETEQSSEPCIASQTCENQGAQCGVINDGCGKFVDCGGCTKPEKCGALGDAGKCGTAGRH